MRTRKPRRYSRWLGLGGRVVWTLVVVILAGEVLSRVGTFAVWRIGLARWPEIAQRIEHTGKLWFPRFTKEIVLGEPEDVPAPIFYPDGRVEWTTFDALPEAAFRSPPAEEVARPGVVRIAFFGGSTTWNEYPEEVGKRLALRFGEGRVEVLNLGVPSSHSGTSLILMDRYLPRWRPHIAVVYHGFNDQVTYGALSRALLAQVDGIEMELAPSRSRGLWSLARAAFVSPAATTRFDEMLEEGLSDRAEDAWWKMARLAWAEGVTLVFSTFAAPNYSSIDDAERAYFEAEFTYIFPWVGGTGVYPGRLSAQNARIRSFTALAGLPVADVANAIRGGRDIFTDNCHLNELGRYRQSDAVAAVLAEPVQRLLAAGVPPPVAPVVVSAPALPEQSSDGCNRGPCPAGACLVEAGRARLGYAPADQERIGGAIRAALGVPPDWYTDTRVVEEWEHGAFCLDRLERSRADRAACVAAKACPPYVEPPDADLPASLPTAGEARALCAFFGGRIPDEREWEAGARGGDGRLLPWGDEWTGTEANLCGRECRYGQFFSPHDGAIEQSARGEFSGTSPSGLLDVAGNLAEWVESCTGESCTDWLRGGSALSPPGLLWRSRPDGFADRAPRFRGVRCAFDVDAAEEP